MSAIFFKKWAGKVRLDLHYWLKIFLIVVMVAVLFVQITRFFNLVNQPLGDELSDRVSNDQPVIFDVDNLLFGEGKVLSVDTEQIPETSLNFILTGVLIEEFGENSSAMIQSGDGSNKVYHTGDKLPGGASLHQVFPKYVVIENEGLMQQLRFPKKTNGVELQAAPPLQPIIEVVPNGSP